MRESGQVETGSVAMLLLSLSLYDAVTTERLYRVSV